MSRPGYTDRSKLRAWADTRQAESEFPRLVRRLILETTPGLTDLGMPAGEGVAVGEWDGTVRTTAATAWVPEGLSVWELSVNAKPGTKAQEDYVKRLTSPDGSPTVDCTYIASILRVWTKRGEWANERRDDKRWRTVFAYGLDKIDAWLEAAPVTWAWFSEELGLQPYGLRTASTWWDAWSRQTDPSLTPELVLGGRDATVTAIRNRLDAPSITTIDGDSVDETCALIAAMAVSADGAGDGRLLARLVFVSDPITWRGLLDQKQPLVLVPLDPDLAKEVPSGSPHSVLVPVVGTNVAEIDIQPLDASAVKTALEAAGLGDERKAEAAARLARRSLTAMRRSLALNKALHRPPWADSPVQRSTRAALLAGSWADLREGDQAILSALAGEDYEQVREAAVALADRTDPLLITTDGSWHLVSPFDTWLLLADRLTTDDIRRLESVVATVIGEDDPSLDLPPDDRWMAAVHGKVRAYSSDLRGGLARSLALLGVHGSSVTMPHGATGASWANHIVRSLLEPATAPDGGDRVWASLSDLLPTLAEAGPDAFVAAVDAATAGPNPVLRGVFVDTDGSGLFSSSPHTGLLWALEKLAWSGDHFGAVADLLARLDEIDPGGRLSNRPFASLAAMFWPYRPQSGVSPDRRLKVLDKLRQRHPETAWKLLLGMLPNDHGFHTISEGPRFRDWRPASTERATNAELLAAFSQVVVRCIQDARDDGARWKDVLSTLGDLPPDDRQTIVSALESLIDDDALAPDASVEIWNELRGFVSRHRDYPDARWSLPENALAPLEALAERLTPQDPILSHEWLFQEHSPHIDGASIHEDYDAYEALLATRRAEAIGEIEQASGLDAIRALAQRAAVSWSVGTGLAESAPTYDRDLLTMLEDADASDNELASQYFFRRFRDLGWPWLTELLDVPDTTPGQKAGLLRVAREFPRAWEVAAEHGSDVETLYWRSFPTFGLGQQFEHVEYVAQKLLDVGRNAAAIDFIALYRRSESTDEAALAEYAASGLEQILVSSEDDPEIRSLSSHDFDYTFELLERHRQILGDDRVAQLEWGFLPALGLDPEVPALHEALANQPYFFVDIICAVYRRRGDDDDASPEDDEDKSGLTPEQRQTRARNAYGLLSSWNRPPGMRDGRLDPELTQAWLDEARLLLTERGRLEVGLNHFGHVLASTPADTDGSWPGEVVRDLLQDLQSDRVDEGLFTEILNGRGVTSRGLEDGGASEERLATRYRSDADLFADEWPRTAALLRNIAKSYDADARRNDDSAERVRRGLDGPS